MRLWWLVLVLAPTACAEDGWPTVKAPPQSGFRLRVEASAPVPIAAASPAPEAPARPVAPAAPAVPIPDPPGVDPTPARPPELTASAAGVGWFCFRSTRSDHGSVCGRTRADCERGRQILLKDGVPTAPCLAQGTAACFTCVDRLQQTKQTRCSATFSDCAIQRAYELEQELDVSDVSDCGPVK